MSPSYMDFFDTGVSSDIRRQTFFAQATAGMSDVERARFYNLPDGCRMREGAKIISPEKLSIGENVWIGENAVLDASGELTIGSHCSIGLGVYLWTHDSHRLNLAGTNSRGAKDAIRRRPTRIGNNCFIAGPSVVMPGVTVGDGCVIAPLSLVAKDLTASTIFTPYRNMEKAAQRINVLESRIRELERRISDQH